MNSLIPFLLLLLFFILGSLGNRWFSSGNKSTINISPLEGMRAVLAFFVFLHHAHIWKQFVTSGQWAPDINNNLYHHFGETSVSLFFMISAYIFVGKILCNKICWTDLYLSRFLRIVPLWAFMWIVFSCVFLSIGGSFKLSVPVEFSGLKSIPISIGYSKITAGVTWSLFYEWFLYFSLPIISFLIFRQSKVLPLVFSLFSLIACFFAYRYSYFPFLYFLMGGASVFVTKYDLKIIKSLSSTYNAILFSILIFILLSLDISLHRFVVLLFSTLLFILIVSGMDFFGILKSRSSLFLGSMGYSLYLMQGPVLFLAVYFVGFKQVALMSEAEYWIFIASVIPFYIAVCRITYLYVETLFYGKNQLKSLKKMCFTILSRITI